MTFVALECVKALNLWPVPVTVFVVKVFRIIREGFKLTSAHLELRLECLHSRQKCYWASRR